MPRLRVQPFPVLGKTWFNIVYFNPLRTTGQYMSILVSAKRIMWTIHHLVMYSCIHAYIRLCTHMYSVLLYFHSLVLGWSLQYLQTKITKAFIGKQTDKQSLQMTADSARHCGLQCYLFFFYLLLTFALTFELSQFTINC